MQVLLTSIVCESGLFTHVLDLTNSLAAHGIKVSVAIKKSLYVNNKRFSFLLRGLRMVPHCIFESEDELEGFAKNQECHLVHAQSSATFTCSASVAHRLGVPLVVTLHGISQWLTRYPQVLDQAEAIIAVGPAQAWSVMPKYKKKTVIIQNGIDVQRFRPENLQTACTGPLHVLWFGRVDGRLSRGIEPLAKAIQNLQQQGCSIQARIVGKTACPVSKEFEVYGWQDNPVPHLQWGHVAFGHGRSLREAMACGNVGFLLAYSCGGLIHHGRFRQPEYTMDAFPEYGFCPPDADNIAGDLHDLYEHRALLQSLRREARGIAERFFDVEIMTQETIELYREFAHLPSKYLFCKRQIAPPSTPGAHLRFGGGKEIIKIPADPGQS